MFNSKTVILAMSVISALISVHGVANAANECRIKYGYHTIKFGKRTDHTKIINLNVNQSKTINQARLNYVKNLKNNKVYVDLSGNGVVDVTLDKDKVNPPAAYYLVPVTLKSLKCLNQTSAQVFTTPQALINAYKLANKTATEIAQGLNTIFSLGGKQVTQLLRSAGYASDQVAAALKSTFPSNLGPVAGWLKSAGYTGAQIAASLKSKYNANAHQLTPLLRLNFNASPPDIAGWLKSAGFTASEVIRALKEKLGVSLEEARRILSTVFKITGDAANQLLSTAGYAIQETRSRTERAVSNAIKIRDIEYGDNFKSCNSMSNKPKYGVAGLPALPMPNDNRPHRITINAKGPMRAVNSLRGFPPGSRLSIVEHGSCYLVVEFRVPRNIQQGRSGRAILRVGNANGPGFNWVIGSIPPPVLGQGYTSNGGGVGVARGNQSSNNSTPDLVPTFTGNVLRHQNANSRKINQNFCQNLPIATGTNAATGIITVPNISWGVINNANVHSVPGNFRISLSGANNQILRNQLVTNMGGKASQTFVYVRPQSRTRVILITPTTNNTIRNAYGGAVGCYQMLMSANDSMNWQDPAYTVKVDTENSIQETSEINNSAQY